MLMKEAAVRRCFSKEVFLKILQYSHKKHLCQSLFKNRLGQKHMAETRFTISDLYANKAIFFLRNDFQDAQIC